MSQDVMPCALCASFPADHSVEAAEVPTPPTQHVLPKALPVALLLIRTLCQKAACMSYTQKPSVPGWGLASLVAYGVDCPKPGEFSDAIQ